MSILLNKNTNILVQGITGSEGSFHAEQMMEYGSKVVCGVTPGKGGHTATINKLPVFNSIDEAKKEFQIDATVIFVPPRFAAKAIIEAIKANVELIVCISEGIPVRDMVTVKNMLDKSSSTLIGPNCPGLITAEESKIGITPETLLEMVKELVEGGVNFIKEDEIMSNPAFCTIEERVPLIMEYLKDKDVIYSVSIHSDMPYLLDRVKLVHELGGNSVHVNFWCGIGIYRAIRELDLPIFIHFQKSGDKILTNRNHAYYVDWTVICKLAGMMGVDFIHAGMIGGYYKWPEDEVVDSVKVLRDYGVMPALSCGFHPGLTKWVTDKVGTDYMANVGGALHGHPTGTLSGAKAMRQSIEGEFGKEYYDAIEKWGLEV